MAPGHRAIASRGLTPLMVTSPESGSNAPMITSVRVDLPAPVLPTRATELPALAWNVTSTRAGGASNS